MAEEIAEKQAEVSALTKQITDLAVMLNQHTDYLEKLKIQKADLETSVQSLTEQINTLSVQLVTMQKDADSFYDKRKDEIRTSQDILDAQQIAILNQGKSIEEQADKLTQREAILTGLENLLKEDQQKLADDRAAFSVQQNNLRDQIVEVNATRDSLQTSISDNLGTLNQLNERSARLDDWQKSLEDKQKAADERMLQAQTKEEQNGGLQGMLATKEIELETKEKFLNDQAAAQNIRTIELDGQQKGITRSLKEIQLRELKVQNLIREKNLDADLAAGPKP